MSDKASMIKLIVDNYSGILNPTEIQNFRKALQNVKGPLGPVTNPLMDSRFESEKFIGKRYGPGEKAQQKNIREFTQKYLSKTTQPAPAPTPTAAPAPAPAPTPAATPSSAQIQAKTNAQRAVRVKNLSDKGTPFTPVSQKQKRSWPGLSDKGKPFQPVSQNPTVRSPTNIPLTKIRTPDPNPRIGSGGGVGGGLLSTAVGALGNMAIPWISERVIEGGLLLTGQDKLKKDAQRRNAGLPVIRNIDGVSYNVGTESGLNAFKAAKARGGNQSTPGKAKSSSSKPKSKKQDTGKLIGDNDFLLNGLTTTALTPPASVKTETDTPDAPKPPGQRENANGIIQKGKDLSSSNLGRQMLLELPELDANRFIQSEGPTPAPGAGMNLNMPGISADTATVPFKVPDGATPSFASELSPEVSDAVAFWKSQSSSPTLPSSYGTDFTPLSIDTAETKAKPKSAPNPDQFGGVDPDTASLVSPMYANATRNAARSAFLDAPNSEGPMGTIRRRNAAVGLNAAGNIARIDGANYNVSPDQAFALTGGAGNTREGLDGIKNTATPYVAPGTAVSNVSERFDTSKLTPAGIAAVEATAQPIMGVQDLVPTNPNFSTEGMTDENAEEFMKRFRAALQAGS